MSKGGEEQGRDRQTFKRAERKEDGGCIYIYIYLHPDVPIYVQINVHIGRYIHPPALPAFEGPFFFFLKRERALACQRCDVHKQWRSRKNPILD